MKKIFLITLIGVTAFSFISCSKKDTNTSTDSSSSAIEETNPDNEEDNKDNGDSDLDSNEDNDNDANAKPDDKPDTKPKPDDTATPKPDQVKRTFKIVTKDINYKVVSGGEIKTTGLGVADNIKKILSTISTKYFDNTSIELSTIETINNKKIAVINLGGSEKYWHEKLQGSVGGQVTEFTLIENVLQKQYTGYWVDGVKFTLNGKPLKDTSHAPNLANITYR